MCVRERKKKPVGNQDLVWRKSELVVGAEEPGSEARGQSQCQDQEPKELS